MLLLRLLSKLPFSVIYIISDFMAFLAYRVFNYRKKLVLGNLRKSFPEKSEREIKEVAKRFYLNLSDVLLETIKSLTITPKELTQRVAFKNIEYMLDTIDSGKSIIALTSHLCNWEWILLANSLKAKQGTVVGGYQFINHRFTNDLFLKIRSRFGAKMVEKKNILKDIFLSKDQPKMYGLVADQTPVGELSNRYWTTFLNQETVFYLGGEKIAKKNNMVVVYVEMKRIKRGYYEIHYIPIDQPPYSKDENFITKSYVTNLEKGIKEAPENWLWSHNRWKFEKEAKISIHRSLT